MATGKVHRLPFRGRRMPERQGGFTLIELAFVLVILGILMSMGAGLVPLLINQNKLNESRAIVREAKTAVMGYALATGRLPWAAAGTDGAETVSRQRGYLPHETLGIPGTDSYTSPLFYSVDPYLATSSSTQELKGRLAELITGSHAPGLFCDGTNIRAAFVVISPGKNLEADAPNDDNHNGIVSQSGDDNRFAKPGEPQTSDYDDILDAVTLTYLHGRLE
ncbi:MAG: type II secretion system protein [Desulfomonilia bacterium]